MNPNCLSETGEFRPEGSHVERDEEAGQRGDQRARLRETVGIHLQAFG